MIVHSKQPLTGNNTEISKIRKGRHWIYKIMSTLSMIHIKTHTVGTIPKPNPQNRRNRIAFICKLKAKILESQIIKMSLGASKPTEGLNRIVRMLVRSPMHEEGRMNFVLGNSKFQ